MTGAADHNVCIWNLLPVISHDYEIKGNKKGKQEGAENGVPGSGDNAQSNIGGN